MHLLCTFAVIIDKELMDRLEGYLLSSVYLGTRFDEFNLFLEYLKKHNFPE